MKKLNTTQPLLTLKGEELKEGQTVITVGLVITNILSGADQLNPHLSYQLGKKIATEPEVELKAEEVVYIKNALKDNKALSALYLGQAIEILES